MNMAIEQMLQGYHLENLYDQKNAMLCFAVHGKAESRAETSTTMFFTFPEGHP